MRERPPEPEYVTRFYRRHVPWALALTFGGMLIVAGPWGWTRSIRSLTADLGFAWDTTVWMALIMLPFAVWFAVAVAWERRLLRRVRTTGGRLCPRCTYPLVGRTGSITCPECGARCEMDDIERLWRAFRPRITGGGITGR